MGISPKMRKKLQKRKEDLAAKNKQGYDYIVFKEGTTRLRFLPVADDEEPGFPITHFYLGGDIKGVVSPATFGEPCAIMEMFEELSKGDESDKELANDFKPKEKYLLPCIRFEDEKGKKIDEKTGQTLALLSGPQYQTLIDFFLDEDWGDFTDPKKGYDIKVKRTGKGMMDTKYTFTPAKVGKIPKSDKNYGKSPIDIEAAVRDIVPSYERTKDFINQFLNLDDEDDKPSKKKKGKKTSKKKVSKKSSKKGKRKKKVTDD